MADPDSVMKQIESGSRLIYLGKCSVEYRTGARSTGGEFIISSDQIVYVEKRKDKWTGGKTWLTIRMPNATFYLYEGGECVVSLPESPS